MSFSDVKTEQIARRLSGQQTERPRHEPAMALPLALRSVHRSAVSAGRIGPPSANRIILAKWVIAGEAAMELHGQRFHFGPGDIAVSTPGIPHAFWAIAPVNEMAWFTVDGPLAESFARHLDLKPGVYPFGPAPLQQLTELSDSLADHSLHGRRRSSLLAIGLLYDIADRVGTLELPAVVRQAQHIIEAEFANSELSTEGIAARLSYHRGSLSRLFHQHAGVTIIDYITHVRLQEARLRLNETADKVAEVGRRCGFRDPTYFCRWVRKHTGRSPKELRGHVAT